MSAEDLYGHIKNALAFFDLAFHEMSKVQVRFGHNQVMFIYLDKQITINT